MKKLKKAQDELNFIFSAGPAALTEYISSYPLRPKAEKPFVETAPCKVISLYIELYGLKPSAAVVIFRQGKPDLVQKLIAWCHDDVVMMKTFLAHGQWQQIQNYIQYFDVPVLPEQNALLRFDEDELAELIKKTKLSPFAKYDILVRGSEELAIAVIRKGGLDTRERDYIIRYGSRALLEALLLEQTSPKTIEYLKQIMLIRFGRRRHILAFITQQRFQRAAEEFFLENATFEMLLGYVKHYRPEGGDLALLKHPDRDGILTYLSKHWICEEGEHFLLKRGDHDEIKVYIKSHHLNPDDEVRLIKRGRHREIMLYIAKHSLSAEAQQELVYRRNLAEICLLITSYPLSIVENTVEILEKCSLTEALEIYDEVMSYV